MRFIGENGSFEKHYFAYEKDFEFQIYRFSKELFRDGRIVRWDPLLIDEFSQEIDDKPEGVKPDSLLVNLDFDEWWVVEVELGRRKKFSDMVSQLNKLSRINYTKYVDEIHEGLCRMYPEKPSDFLYQKAKILSSQPPNFLLILDDEEKRMIEWAEKRNWNTLIIEVWTNSVQYRLSLSNEISVTKEKIIVDIPDIIIDAPSHDKPLVLNNFWYFQILDSNINSKNGLIIIDDGNLSFDVELIEKGNGIYLKLPVQQKSINRIVKADKIGKLYHENKNRYQLKSYWS